VQRVFPDVRAQRCKTSSTFASIAMAICSPSLLALSTIKTAYQKPGIAAANTMITYLNGFVIYFPSISKICRAHMPAHYLTLRPFARKSTRLSILISLKTTASPA
jgi:hypothetical protein